MTSRERMLTAMWNKEPDMVPVAPDISNMIPCKLTGKPFWDIYLYKDPPIWKAYIDAVRYFGFDGWLDDVPNVFEEELIDEHKGKEVIIFQSPERIITREYIEKNGIEWSEFVTVYYKDNPPIYIKAAKIGIESSSCPFYLIEGIKPQKKNEEILKEVKEYMGENGVVGVGVFPPALGSPEGKGYSIYDYDDSYKKVKEWSIEREEKVLKRLYKILSSPIKPDFILTGGSGLLVFNTLTIFRDITLPCLQKITKMCKEAGIPSQVHCCGPEREIVRICAEETDLNGINPLETSPMGDCNLKEIKERFGKKVSLMGNLHTTEVMLCGSVKDMEEASKKAMDDAAEGGGFILSTGDQCGRDTPEKNIFNLKS